MSLHVPDYGTYFGVMEPTWFLNKALCLLKEGWRVTDKLKAMMDLGYSERDAIVFVRANGKCEYCDSDLIQDRIAWDSVQFDHVIPKSKGGDDEEGNLALSCKVCNNAKMTFYPQGSNREERIVSARDHIRERRKNADQFWGKVCNVFCEGQKT
ncbi:MAG: HNH endonuclease signature motif containing protein [Nevskiales bacterium]|nr:HNH endonuclease signature motif containing protein [Nevskiales bacterium]